MSACGSCTACDLSTAREKILPLSRQGEARPDKTASEQRGDFTPPYRYPFLLGYYLAVNAIPDSAGIVDGPDCLFFKAEIVHGKHDLHSSLLRVDGRHRILVSHVNTDNLTKEQGHPVRAHLAALRRTNTRVAFISSLPMVTIIGTQYDALIREQKGTTMELIDVPGRSLEADWLAGYSDTLEALARHLSLPAVDPRDDVVAVIGNLMERNEEDHRGNVRELERLCNLLGLELATVWLGDQGVDQLARVAEAGTLISLPLGRNAAQILSDRTGAQVIDLDTPFGIGRTNRFLRHLGKATGRRDLAEQVIEQELRAALPKLEWLVPHSFLGKRVAFSGTPDLIPGFVSLAQDLGMEVVHLSSPTRRPSWLDDLAEFGPLPPILFDVSHAELSDDLQRCLMGDADLLIGCSPLLRYRQEHIASVELGFPSYTHHALHDQPFLGYRGMLDFVGRMANALALHGSYMRKPRHERARERGEQGWRPADSQVDSAAK